MGFVCPYDLFSIPNAIGFGWSQWENENLVHLGCIWGEFHPNLIATVEEWRGSLNSHPCRLGWMKWENWSQSKNQLRNWVRMGLDPVSGGGWKLEAAIKIDPKSMSMGGTQAEVNKDWKSGCPINAMSRFPRQPKHLDPILLRSSYHASMFDSSFLRFLLKETWIFGVKIIFNDIKEFPFWKIIISSYFCMQTIYL